MERGGNPGHGTRMVMDMHPAGAEPEGVLVIHHLGRGLILNGVEQPQTPGKLVFVQKLGARMVLIGTGPGKSVAF